MVTIEVAILTLAVYREMTHYNCGQWKCVSITLTFSEEVYL